MIQFGDVYRNCSVLVTGDSGFKGSWLTKWLCELGAQVYGLALPPDTTPNHQELLRLKFQQFRGDIRQYDWVDATISQVQPQILFHLAAQPLVRRSYRDPLGTWSTNVMGTANVLQACREVSTLQAIVIVTTDKVYLNREWSWGYRETDQLGGHDPYSASKASCELVVDSFRNAFFSRGTPLVATVRAGNVIGGGDWAEDRLIPDLVLATSRKQTLEIRSPQATRPWQHVLECLSAYLLIGKKLLEGDRQIADAWNIGPDVGDNRPVIDILEEMKRYWPSLDWQLTNVPQPHEAGVLYLDSSKARSILGWQPVWGLSTALEKTARWYRAFYETGEVQTQQQLDEFLGCARQRGCSWAS